MTMPSSHDHPDEIAPLAPRAWRVTVTDLASPGTLCVLLGDGVARITTASRLTGAGYGADSSGNKVEVNRSSPIGLSSTEQRAGSTSLWRAPTRPVTITAGTSLSHA